MYFVLYFIFCHFNQSVGKNFFYFTWRQIHFHACLICTLLDDFFFLKNQKINLGCTCFNRVGRKSETYNIFLGLITS